MRIRLLGRTRMTVVVVSKVGAVAKRGAREVSFNWEDWRSIQNVR